jgi:hypothetical protein
MRNEISFRGQSLQFATKADFIYHTGPDWITIADTGKGKCSVADDLESVLRKIEVLAPGLDREVQDHVPGRQRILALCSVGWQSSCSFPFRRDRRAKSSRKVARAEVNQALVTRARPSASGKKKPSIRTGKVYPIVLARGRLQLYLLISLITSDLPASGRDRLSLGRSLPFGNREQEHFQVKIARRSELESRSLCDLNLDAVVKLGQRLLTLFISAPERAAPSECEPDLSNRAVSHRRRDLARGQRAMSKAPLRSCLIS